MTRAHNARLARTPEIRAARRELTDLILNTRMVVGDMATRATIVLPGLRGGPTYELLHDKSARSVELPDSPVTVAGFPHLELAEVVHGKYHTNPLAYPGDKVNRPARRRPPSAYAKLALRDPLKDERDDANFQTSDFNIDDSGRAVFYGSLMFTTPLDDSPYKTPEAMRSHYAKLHMNTLAIAGIVAGVLGDAYMIDNESNIINAAGLHATWAEVGGIKTAQNPTLPYWVGVENRLPVWNRPLAA